MAMDPHSSFDRLLQKITNRIPSAFLYPRSTFARLTIGPTVIQTADCAACRWRIASPITAEGKAIGTLEVGYIGARPLKQSPFPDEEQRLLRMLAAHIGLIVHNKTLIEIVEQSRSEHQILIDNDALVGVTRSNGAGKLLYANATALRMFGYENLEEAINAPAFTRCKHKADQAALLNTLRRRGKVSDFEVEYMTRSGGSLFVLLNAVLENDVITGTMVDITTRKHVEKALTRKEGMLEKTQRIAHVGSWELDLDRGMLYCSDEAYRIFGIPGKPVSMAYSEFLAMVHPGDRQKLEQAVHELLTDSRRDQGLECRILLHDGTERTVFLRGEATYDDDGKPLQIIGTVLDITRRKSAENALIKSESRLTEAQRIGHVGSWDWEVPTGDLHWSDETYRIFGLQPQEFGASYDAFLARVHAEDRQDVENAVKRSLADPAVPYSIEHRIVRSGGSERTVQERGEVTFDGYGTPLRMMGTVHDITEHKEAEQEIRRLKDMLEAENVYLRRDLEQKEGYDDIIAASDAIQSAMRRSRKVAPTKTTVLLTGETGTGKGIFARYIHKISDRGGKPFVNVNCAGLPANLIESELFGREKGAFTGSTARQIGRFDLANKGTIFLDEIGELPLELQAKLLKVIEEQEFERLGSPYPVKADVRIIASTNRNLLKEIENGRFRRDLFFRLNVFPITIPPLKERKGDIPLLVRSYTEKFSKKYNKRITTIPPSTMDYLDSYPWPGNVRELINVIERAVIVSDGPDLQLVETTDEGSLYASRDPEPVSVEPWTAKPLVEAERHHILSALQATGWRIEGPRGSARLLGINPSTLRTRMKKLAITRPGS